MMKTRFMHYWAYLLFVYGSLVCAPFLLFTACSDDDEPTMEMDEGVPDSPPRGSIATDATVDYPAATLGNIPADMREALTIRFSRLGNAVDEDTDVLFVTNSDLASYQEEIVAVYENGGIIVIVDPDVSATNEWLKQIGWENELVDDGVEKELYAFGKYHQYLLDKAYEGITLNEHLNYFVDWVNESLVSGLQAEPGNGETAIDKLVAAQTITHTYSYSMNVQETDPDTFAPDWISGDGSFTAKYGIYALYAFQGQPSAGDYYIVSAEYTAHNKDMCPVESSTHNWVQEHGIWGWIKVRLCGFYLTRFNVETFLTNSKKERIGEFQANYSPVPLTTQGSTTYSSGMSWNLGADIAAGVDAKGPNGSITIKGGVSFSNSESRTISDVEILNQSTNNSAKYEYKVNNLPSYVVSKIAISDPPLVSVSNATLFGSWIWRVPNTKDRGTDKFLIGTKPEITYGSCHFYTTGADLVRSQHNVDFGKDDTRYTAITPPNRVPTGLLRITNTNEGEYISDVVITDDKGEVAYSSSGKGSVAFNNSFLRYVPTGTYTVEFKMGPNTQSTKTYKNVETIEIKRGEEIDLNSAFDFEEK